MSWRNAFPAVEIAPHGYLLVYCSKDVAGPYYAAFGLSRDILETNHAVAEQLLRKFLKPVARRGIEAVMLKHRVTRRRRKTDSVAMKDCAVILAVVRDENL